MAWGDPLPDDVLIWTMEKKVGKVEPKKLSYWLTGPQGLRQIVNGFSQERNIYMGVGVPGPDTNRGQFNRCESAEISGICGLYGDVDFADPNAPAAHRKSNLPPNCEAALELIEAMPVPPTVIVHSGHGLQPYWLFTAPWMFDDAAERDRARDLSYSWNAQLIQLAKERGWQMDSVFDLARVLRVPGTLNLKPDCPPVPVRVLQWDGPKYSPDELACVVTTLSAPPSGTAGSENSQSARMELDGAWLTGAAELPTEKFQRAYRNSEKFADSWDRNRVDLADQSGSGYDFSLATLAAAFGWLDAEIVALLIAHHRKHGTDLKLDRPQYYSHTIGKARAAVAGRESTNLTAKSNSPDTDLTLSEMQAGIGKYHLGPGQVIHRKGEESETPKSPNRGPVADRVKPPKLPHRRSDKSKDRGPRPALWAEAKELFPLPSHTKPRMKGYLLWSERDRKGLAVDMFSNTWRNPVNAQYKRQKLYFNILPRINGPQIYRRQVPFDDWDNRVHGRISRAIQRRMTEKQGWLNVDNALDRGYILYLTDVPGPKGFEPVVEDVGPILIDALKAIHPPSQEKEKKDRFRPYGGSQNWVGKAESTGEEDAGRWEMVAVAKGKTDFEAVEAECVETGVKTENTTPFWRGQPYHGLAMRHSSREAFLDFAQIFGDKYTLTKAAMADRCLEVE